MEENEPKDTENDLKDANEVEGTEAEKMTLTRAKKKKPPVNRIQMLDPSENRWVKIDTITWEIIDQKKTPGPYKGIRKLEPTYKLVKTKSGVAVIIKQQRKKG